MKLRLSPVDIALKDLPPEGREFNYSNETGELNAELRELIGGNRFSVNFRITPVGNAYDLKGTVQTSMDLQCALCAMDFVFPVRQNLHELLVLQKPLSKGEQLSKANHAHEWENAGPDYILLATDMFHVADYIHEMVALAEPIRPLGKPDCDVNCENMPESAKKWIVTEGSQTPLEPIKANPFKVLEKIKLKS